MNYEIFDKMFDITVQSTTGRRRENQDRAGFVIGGKNGTTIGFPDDVKKISETERKGFVLAFVCDGMGGMRDGAAASTLLSNALVQWATNVTLNIDDALISLSDTVREVDKKLMADIPGSGTTLSAVLAIDNDWRSIHLGDSRCYAVSPNSVWRTKDHSPVEELFKKGLIDEDEMNDHPLSNVVSRYVGGGFSESLEIQKMETGWDSLTLCSDGAFGYMPPEEFVNELRANKDAASLVKAAYDEGSSDNISMVVIKQERNIENKCLDIKGNVSSRTPIK